MNDLSQVSTEDFSIASFNLVVQLMGHLTQAGALSGETVNAVAAGAASVCRNQGHEAAAALIGSVIPTSQDMDPMVEAMKRGIAVAREGQPND